MRLPVTFHQTGGANHIYLALYKDWLSTQSITPNTSRAYYSRIKQFLVFLEYGNLSSKPINDPGSLNHAISAYLNFLKQNQKGHSTINAVINTLNNFAEFLGVENGQFKRNYHYEKTSKILTAAEQERFLKAVDQQEWARDKAVALVLFYTGLRIGECARLTISNVGAGGVCLCLDGGATVQLNKETMTALRLWLEERKKLPNAPVETALWLNKQGECLKTAGITCVIERIGWQAKLTVCAETLRRTYLTKTTAQFSKDELILKFGGYINKSTIKRYGLSLSLTA